MLNKPIKNDENREVVCTFLMRIRVEIARFCRELGGILHVFYE